MEEFEELKKSNLKFKSAKNVGELLSLAKEEEIVFYDFRFTDIKGAWHHISYCFDSVDENSFKGLPFDGSSIPAWQSIEKSDMLLKPDFKSAFIDPFLEDKTLVVFCDVYDIYKEQPYEFCPRSIAKRALKHLSETGIGDTAYFGPENEFFVFDDIKVRDSINSQYYEIDSVEGVWNSDKELLEEPNLGHRPGTKGGYFPCAPVDSLIEFRAEVVKNLQAVGLKTFVLHHEVAQGQSEIGVEFATLVEAADNVQKLKYIVKNVAYNFDKTATFMPKPLYGDNGSGMHVHFSIWKEGKNLFHGDKYQDLSDTALNAVGGVLQHARSIAAFTNSSTNSYKRLVPGFEAPSILAYSGQNRSASCRIPYGSGEKSKRVEFRFPDSSANPYLAFSSILMGALDGIKNKKDPGKPRDENLFELTLDEIREKGIQQMPHTLRGALESMLEDNGFYREGNVFTDSFLQRFKDYKFETEVWPWEGKPHPFEFISTYSC